MSEVPLYPEIMNRKRRTETLEREGTRPFAGTVRMCVRVYVCVCERERERERESETER